MIDEKVLKSEERAIFNLRSLYRKYGYAPYKMSKFEEYELYLRNKDFLVSDRVITFNDTNGRLMALKPDVTLSIIKNGEDKAGEKQKVYYSENVYRVSEGTHRFKEIMQAGLECIGDIDIYDVFECVSLAAQSLASVSEDFVLEVSHLGVIASVLEGEDASFAEDAIKYISDKNGHDLARLCEKYDIDSKKAEALQVLISAYGNRAAVIEKLSGICEKEIIEPLITLSKMLDTAPFGEKILFDFSVVNNMSYYSGFVFSGFLDGICDGVLTGGQYDKMMEKMGRVSGAVGFAIYLDLLEQLERNRQKADFDVNVLLLYNDKTDKCALAEKAMELVAEGLTVSAQKAVPEALRYREMIDMRGEEK